MSKKIIHGKSAISPVFIDLLLHNNFIPNSSVVIRKSIIDKVGFQTEDKAFIAIEDYDYLLSISTVTNRFKFIDKVLGYYYVGDTSISSNDKWISLLDAINLKHIPKIEDKRLRAKVEKQTLYYRLIVCKFIGNQKEYRKTLRQSFGRGNSLLKNLKIVYRILGLPTKKVRF